MAYPSIRSQPGSADRNLQPISDALSPLIEDTLHSARTGEAGAESEEDAAQWDRDRVRIFEIGSLPYTHIRSFARRWPRIHWTGSGRDAEEVNEINDILDKADDVPDNLSPPVKLDVAHVDDWQSLREHIRRSGSPSDQVLPHYDGVIMLNLIHCLEEHLPERIFENLSPGADRPLLAPRGWIAAYGAFKQDDGSYKSEKDEKVLSNPHKQLFDFDREHIRSKHPSLGLRSIASISAMAQKWGFVEESRQEVAAGNMFVVWRAKA